MRTTNQLLDQVKQQKKLPSDYALAKLLQVTSSRIGNYRSGRSTMDVDLAIKVADILGEDQVKIVAMLEEERARSESARAFWQRLGGTAAAVLFTWWIVGQDTAPALLQLVADASTLCVLCKIADPGYLWHLALAAFCIAALWHLATRRR